MFLILFNICQSQQVVVQPVEDVSDTINVATRAEKLDSTSNTPIPTFPSPITNRDHLPAYSPQTANAGLTLESSFIPDMVVMDPPVRTEGAGDPETRRKRRKQARDEARAAAKPNLSVVLPSSTIIIRSSDDSEPTAQIEVPLQLVYTGKSRAIPSALADVSCASLGATGLLENLNNILGTSYTLNTPSLSAHIEACISRGYDLGTAYGHLRPWWYFDFVKLNAMLETCQIEDEQMRRTAIDPATSQIIKPLLRPRRVWDLFSNRVLPMWVIRRDPWAISHSWMDIQRRQLVDTPINGHQWHVPIPIDTTLERVRVELLNYEAEYVWLDVLCLRQGSGPTESLRDKALRIEEWKLDVPTIGHAYHQNQKIVHYFSGLGRPFYIGDLNSPRHWLNRAWTLQEISENRIVAGVVADSPLNPGVGGDVDRFYERLAALQIFAQDVDSVFPVLASMQGRSAESDLDKVAGLAYLLRSPRLPTYDANQAPENAWTHLVEAMGERYRGDLLFLCPTPGNGRYKWSPSWQQVMTTQLPSSGGTYIFEKVIYLAKDDVYRHRGYYIDKCAVRGLATGDAESGARRRAKIIVEDGNGTSYDFAVVAHHQNLIPESEPYVLVGSQGLEYWVVGRIQESGRIEKVSVLRMSHSEVRDAFKKLELGHWKDNDYA